MKEQIEGQVGIAREEDKNNVWDSSKKLVNIKTIQYVKTGQNEIEKS